MVKELVKTSVVKDNDDERVDGTNWVVGLSFLDVCVVGTNEIHRVEKLDVVHPACNSVQAVPKTTSKFENTEHGEEPFTKLDNDSNSHE